MTVLILAGLSMLVVDQLSKRAAARWFDGTAGGRSRPPLRLRCVRSRRGLLGPGARPALGLSLWLGTTAAVLVLAMAYPGLQGWAPRAALGAALGGACGNLLDRLRRGAVVDFIGLGAWPAFNLADVAIVGGVCIALWTALGR